MKEPKQLWLFEKKIVRNLDYKKRMSYKAPKGGIYSSYISSTRWRNLVEKRKKLANYKCEKCGRNDELLSGHHVTYERFMEERLEDIRVYCKKHHAQSDRQRRILAGDYGPFEMGFLNWACNKIYGTFGPPHYWDIQKLWDEYRDWIRNRKGWTKYGVNECPFDIYDLEYFNEERLEMEDYDDEEQTNGNK